MKKSAMFLKRKIDLTKNHRKSMNGAFNRQDSFESVDDDILAWERPTWYTSDRGNCFLPKAPQDLCVLNQPRTMQLLQNLQNTQMSLCLILLRPMSMVGSALKKEDGIAPFQKVG